MPRDNCCKLVTYEKKLNFGSWSHMQRKKDCSETDLCTLWVCRCLWVSGCGCVSDRDKEREWKSDCVLQRVKYWLADLLETPELPVVSFKQKMIAVNLQDTTPYKTKYEPYHLPEFNLNQTRLYIFIISSLTFNQSSGSSGITTDWKKKCMYTSLISATASKKLLKTAALNKDIIKRLQLLSRKTYR